MAVIVYGSEKDFIRREIYKIFVKIIVDRERNEVYEDWFV